jgi:hypothetical protein
MKGTLAALFLAVAISVVDAQVVDECLDASQLLMSTVDAVNRLSARIDGLESMVSAGRDKLDSMADLVGNGEVRCKFTAQAVLGMIVRLQHVPRC